MSSLSTTTSPPSSPSTLQAHIKATTADIAAITSSHLSIHPTTCEPVLQIPQSKLFIIPPTTGIPFKLIIPNTHNLLLYPHPGPLPTTPSHTLTAESDLTTAFPPNKSVSYYAKLVLTTFSESTVNGHQQVLDHLQQQLRESIIDTLYALNEESTRSVTLRTQYGNHVPTISLPAFFLRAFAALGNLLGPDHLSATRDFINIFGRSRNDVLSVPDREEDEVTFASGCEAFFTRTLPDTSQLYADNPMIPTNDPIRLALFSISAALADLSDEGERANPDAVNNEFAFRELFKAYANSPCIVWDLAESWSPSFAWQVETGYVQKFLVNATTFVDSKLVLPVNVLQGSNSIIGIGVAAQGLTHLYSIHDTPSYLTRQPSIVDTLFAAVNLGADWDRMTSPESLSRMRNTASYKMDSSGGSSYQGMYIDSPNAIADILKYGKVGDVKLVDLSPADEFDSQALRDLSTAVDAARLHTKADAKTFKATFGSIMGDIRREICLTIATHGLVFATADGYRWIGVDDNGYMSLKKAVPFNGDPQEMQLPLPDGLRGAQATEEGSEEPRELPDWTMKQDIAFLVQDGEGVKLESTGAIENVSGEGSVGILVLLACVRMRRIALDATFSHALITQRTLVSWVTEKDEMAATRVVNVDGAMKYANLFVLEDNVVVDHDGRGWICGVDYLRGRDGVPGKLMSAETEGCAPMPIVEADFSVPDTLLVSP